MCNINAHILSINKINIRTIICTKFLCAMSFANYLLRNFLPKITVQQIKFAVFGNFLKITK